MHRERLNSTFRLIQAKLSFSRSHNSPTNISFKQGINPHVSRVFSKVKTILKLEFQDSDWLARLHSTHPI